MKKLFLITGLMLALVGLAEAQLASPTLLKPDNAANLPLKKAAKFTWQKVTGASKYRVIFSNDKSFANYDENKFKCLNAKTCFMYTVASPSYNVAATHTMLKTDGGNYFWQAQSVGKTTADNSKTGEIRSFSVGTPLPPAIQSVSVNPQQITLGSSTIIKATLDHDLAVGSYTIKISFNGGESQAMIGSGTDFSFNFKPKEIGEQQFQIDIFDDNGVSIDANGDSFTVIVGSIVATVAIPSAESLTISQKNAVRSAKSYLSFSGFSRNGLIHQLSSDAGDGYSVSDATVAVDSLNNDWNKDAVRSAKSYLSFSGFSRNGLIHQLSSDAGSGYSVSEATVAVDSLNNDWNKEAVRSAKSYLSFSGFSCNGLIHQLSSDSGSGFTVSQATYGAQQVGICQ